MPTTPTGKKGRITRITRVHEDRDIVRVEKETDGGDGPVADVIDHKQTRSSTTPDTRHKGKTAAVLPETLDIVAPGGPTSEAQDSEEAEELLSEAEEMLRKPTRGGTRRVTAAHHKDVASGSEPFLRNSTDAVPDTQHQIEEVDPDTAQDGEQPQPQVEEPESSIAAHAEESTPGRFNAEPAARPADVTSKGQSLEKASAHAATRASKQAEKGKAIASGPTTPSPKGKAAAKRAAEPDHQVEQSPKKAVRRSSKEDPTPAKPAPAPTGSGKQALGPGAKGKQGRPTGKGGKRKKRSVETYKSYIYKVLKEVHPDVGISKQGMQVMQTFAVDMFDRIMVEAARLCRISSKATLSSREIQTAVRLLMPGELSKHAVTEGTKAVTKATKD